MYTVIPLFFVFCSNFHIFSEVQAVHWKKHLTQNHKVQCIHLLVVGDNRTEKSHLEQILRHFLWRTCFHGASAWKMLISAFLVIFFRIFLHIEKLCKILSKCQVSNQLDQWNRNYRRGEQNLTPPSFSPPPPPKKKMVIPVCEKLGLFRVRDWIIKKWLISLFLQDSDFARDYYAMKYLSNVESLWDTLTKFCFVSVSDKFVYSVKKWG